MGQATIKGTSRLPFACGARVCDPQHSPIANVFEINQPILNDGALRLTEPRSGRVKPSQGSGQTTTGLAVIPESQGDFIVRQEVTRFAQNTGQTQSSPVKPLFLKPRIVPQPPGLAPIPRSCYSALDHLATVAQSEPVKPSPTSRQTAITGRDFGDLPLPQGVASFGANLRSNPVKLGQASAIGCRTPQAENQVSRGTCALSARKRIRRRIPLSSTGLLRRDGAREELFFLSGDHIVAHGKPMFDQEAVSITRHSPNPLSRFSVSSQFKANKGNSSHFFSFEAGPGAFPKSSHPESSPADMA